MSDLISRQAALHYIADWQYGEANVGNEAVYDTIENCYKMIEQLPSVQPQRWIRVSEALPKEKQDVLLAFKHNMVVGFWEDILNDGGQAWYANSGNGWFTGTEAVDDDGFPLAWMPLPEPYTSGADMRGEQDEL